MRPPQPTKLMALLCILHSAHACVGETEPPPRQRYWQQPRSSQSLILSGRTCINNSASASAPKWYRGPCRQPRRSSEQITARLPLNCEVSSLRHSCYNLSLPTPPESLAEVGSDLHAAAIEQLVESHRDIETKITDLANSSGPVLSRVDSVYSNIEYPLGATICHSDALPRETITTHLSNLQAKFDDADKELRKLAAEYDSCVRFEEAALSKLRGHRGDTEGGSAEMIRAEQRKAHDFKKEAEDISRRTGRLLEEAEAVRCHVSVPKAVLMVGRTSGKALRRRP